MSEKRFKLDRQTPLGMVMLFIEAGSPEEFHHDVIVALRNHRIISKYVKDIIKYITTMPDPPLVFFNNLLNAISENQHFHFDALGDYIHVSRILFKWVTSKCLTNKQTLKQVTQFIASTPAEKEIAIELASSLKSKCTHATIERECLKAYCIEAGYKVFLECLF